MLRRNLIALALLPLPALAQKTIEGHVYPATMTLAGSTLQLNGVGERAVAWLKGYTAGLYLGARAATAEQVLAAPGAKRLQMRMLQDASTEEFVKAIDKGFDRNTPPEQHAALAPRRAEWDRRVRAIGKVRKGDIVDLDFVPGRGFVFSYNGQARGEPIAGEDFYAAVLLIFIGPRPVDTRLKDGLLGGAAT